MSTGPEHGAYCSWWQRLAPGVLGTALLALSLTLHSGAQASTTPAHVESQARALEGRLHAPCCRALMLEGHESDLTRDLRKEIRTRFLNGETELAIERDLRARYGDAIVAVPSDRDPRPGLSVALVAVLAGSALLLVLLGRRWMRRPGVVAAAGGGATSPPNAQLHDELELDARLDRELRDLDR
jgi:cytochrome c-type biogenesis protein CcmH